MDEAVGQSRARVRGAADLLTEQVASLEKERDELKDNMLRALAETDNVRKRANRQIEDARIYAVEKFARDLLAVSDNLARAHRVRSAGRARLPAGCRCAPRSKASS